MKQYSFSVNNEDCYCEIIDFVRNNAMYKRYLEEGRLEKHAALVLYLFETDDENLSEGIELLNEKLPDLAVIGMTKNGRLSDEEDMPKDNGTLIFTEEAELTPFSYDFDTISSLDAGEDFCRKFHDDSSMNAKGVLLYYADRDINFPEFITIIEDGWNNVPFFGAKAGNDFFAGKEGRVFREKTFSTGVAGLLFSGSDIEIGTAYTLDWKTIGRAITVTELKDPLTVTKMDNRPAIEIYEKYLNVKPGSYFVSDSSSFPMVVSRNGILLARTIMRYGEDGSMTAASFFEKGEKVHIAIGQPELLIAHSRENAKKIGKMEPQALFLFPCQNRLVYMGKKSIEKEIGYFKEVNSEVFYGYGFAEFLREHMKGGAMNGSIVAVGIKENISSKDKQEKNLAIDAFRDFNTEVVLPNDGDHSIPILNRMVNFLEETTKELEQANKILNKLATTDQLTGIANRRKIDDSLAGMINSYKKGGHFSAIMYDIDHFKVFNDTFGHDAGDDVLRIVTHAASLALDERGMLGRFGGEEFMILLCDCTLEEAAVIAEKIRSAVALMKNPYNTEITISLGVAEYQDGETADEFFKRVDMKLYTAKENGRNKVCF